MNWTHRRINSDVMEYINDTNNVTILRNEKDFSDGLPHFICTISGVNIRGCEILEPLKQFVEDYFPENGIYSVQNYCIYLSKLQMY